MKNVKKQIVLIICILLLACLFACNRVPDETETDAGEQEPTVVLEHEHDFCVLQYDADYHWYRCKTCAATNGKEEHKRAGTQCEGECGMRYPSEGLRFTLLEDNTYCLSGMGICFDEEIYVAETYNGLPVTSVGENAFKNNSFVEFVEFAENSHVKRIEKEAFRGSNVSYVELPDSVEYIGEYAYAYCSSLGDVVFGKGLRTIGDYAFAYCEHLSEPEISEEVNVGNNAFLLKAISPLKKPVVSIKDNTATWAQVTGAQSYEYTVFGTEGEVISIGTTSAEDRMVAMKEGQSIIVVAKGANVYLSDSEPSDRKTCVLDFLGKIKKSLKSIEGIGEIYNSVENLLSVDVSAGAYFRQGEEIHDILAVAKANLCADDFGALAEVDIDGQRGVGLTYSNHILYVDDIIDEFFIDVSGLAPGEYSVIKRLILNMQKKWKFDISTSTQQINDLIDMIGGPLVEFGLDTLLDIRSTEDGREMSFGVTCGTMSALFSILEMIPNMPDMNKLIGDLVRTLRDPFLRLILPGLNSFEIDWLDWTYLKDRIKNADPKASPFRLILTYDKDLILNGVKADLDLSAIDKEKLDYAVGINVSINLFSVTEKATILAPKGFEAKELVVDLGGFLNMRDVGADAEVILHLSDMFKSNTSTIVTAKVDVEKEKGGPRAVLPMYIGQEGFYADFEPVCKLFGVQAKEMKYKREWGFSLVDFINELALSEETVEYAAYGGGGTQNATIVFDGEEIDFLTWFNAFIFGNLDDIRDAGDSLLDDKMPVILSIIYNWILRPFVQTYAFPPTEEEWVDMIRDFHQLYSKVKIEGTLGDVFLNLLKIHRDNEDDFYKAVRFQDEETLGVNIINPRGHEDEPSLFKYLSHFVWIPTVVNGIRYYGVMGDVSNPKQLVEWLYSSAMEVPVGLFQNDSMHTLMQNLLGDYIGEDIVANGVYAEMVGKVKVDEFNSYAINGQLTFRRNQYDKDGYFSAYVGFGARDATDSYIEPFDLSEFVTFDSRDTTDFEFNIRHMGIELFLKIFGLEGQLE